jgi:SAM-dependent methyltransferase
MWALGPQERWIDISDPQTEWVSYVNAGMLHRGSLYSMQHAISQLPSSAPILEIGCFCGLSLNLLDYYRRKLKRPNRLLGCDNWQFSGNREGLNFELSGLNFENYRGLVKDSFIRNVRAFSGAELPAVCEMNSNEFFENWAAGANKQDVFGQGVRLGGPLSFCHIDGDHSYEQSHRDFMNCDRFLQPGGFILFDDSADMSEFEGVRRLVQEVQRNPSYELVVKNPHYLFRKRGS